MCGEFTGSRTEPNGPFDEQDGTPAYLTNVAAMLADCHVLVDIAHTRAEGALQAASSAPCSVLVHHHDGQPTAGRSTDHCRSDWLCFKGGEWIGPDAVVPVPIMDGEP